jgi:glycosyltransferase involved in cell wall biosynthesis
MSVKKSPKFSFVIPVLNGAKTLANTLFSIEKQTCRDFEVIVVDNGSIDETKKIAIKFKRKLKNVRYVFHPEKSRSLARNKGAKLARGRYLAFVDADVALSPDWLDQARRYLERTPLDALATRVEPQPESQNALNLLDSYRRELADWRSRGTFLSVLFTREPYPLVNTAACVIDKKSFNEIGGFNPAFARHEDLELSFRFFWNGYSVGGTSDARAKVRFTANSALPKARELSYLWRAMEVRYLALGKKSVKMPIRWRFLKLLWEKNPALFSYGALVDLAGYLGQLARFALPAPNAPKNPVESGGKSSFKFSFTHKNSTYILHGFANFVFIDQHVHLLTGPGRSRQVDRRAAQVIRSLCRSEEITSREKRVLLETEAFRKAGT